MDMGNLSVDKSTEKVCDHLREEQRQKYANQTDYHHHPCVFVIDLAHQLPGSSVPFPDVCVCALWRAPLMRCTLSYVFNGILLMTALV